MSAMDLATFLKKRAKGLDLSVTMISKLTGISRSTWYRLINADVKQARIETLFRLADVLQVSFAELFCLYTSNNKLSNFCLAVKKPQDAFSFIRDVNYPWNTRVEQDKVFKKTWEVINLGNIHWKKRRLICLDKQFDFQLKKDDGYLGGDRNNGRLNVLQDSIEIPPTAPGEHALLSVKFRTPKRLGTTISLWQMVDAEGNYCFPNSKGLFCQVRVANKTGCADDRKRIKSSNMHQLKEVSL